MKPILSQRDGKPQLLPLHLRNNNLNTVKEETPAFAGVSCVL